MRRLHSLAGRCSRADFGYPQGHSRLGSWVSFRCWRGRILTRRDESWGSWLLWRSECALLLKGAAELPDYTATPPGSQHLEAQVGFNLTELWIPNPPQTVSDA